MKGPLLDNGASKGSIRHSIGIGSRKAKVAHFHLLLLLRYYLGFAYVADAAATAPTAAYLCAIHLDKNDDFFIFIVPIDFVRFFSPSWMPGPAAR